uniref:C2H2-type domain-containing protein n=1 Tax=Cacopsylla melanoneura TaxID=428564 RepID=A0A8D9B3J6_9HEMI
MSDENSSLFCCVVCRKPFKSDRGRKIHETRIHQISSLSQSTSIETLEQYEDTEEIEVRSPFDELFIRGFGVSMINSDGGNDSEVWHVRWKCAVKLKGRQYSLPQGAIGRQFVSQLTDEINDLVSNNAVSEKVLFYCSTMLQRDKMITKGIDVRRLLKKRLDMWIKGQFDELLYEAERCNRQMKSNHADLSEDHKVRIFTRLVLQGKLREASRWITEKGTNGVLDIDAVLNDGTTVLDALKSKHPPQKDPDPTVFLQCENLPLMVDVDVACGHIEKVSRTLRGSAGPSGTDSESWKCFLLRYGAHSARLRDAVASLTRYLANGIVPWNNIRALNARRGVALDKCPGVRPIGVGECLQRLCAKTMVLLTGEDVQEECRADQICAGIKSGIEGAIHGISSIFHEEETDGLLIVDAKNAFNILSRPVALWHARILWPRCARFLFNAYQGYSIIVFRNSTSTILSREGTSQGDPLAMLLYAVGILPLIRKLKSELYIQNWYADDSCCMGKLLEIRNWFDCLMSEGPLYGYYPEPAKSFLVVKPELQSQAEQIFQDLNVQVVLSHRFLGSVIGPDEMKKEYVSEKVSQWLSCVRHLARAAKQDPQSALAVLTKSMQFEWSFVQRVVDSCDDEYIPLKDALQSCFLPSLFGREINNLEQELIHLPARLGGLGIADPMKTVQTSFQTSVSSNSKLIHSIKTGEPLNVQEHNNCVKDKLKDQKALKKTQQEELSKTLISQLPPKKKRILERITSGNCSQWLTVIPTSNDHFDLSPTQFRDALAMRYGYELLGLPTNCDGCGQEMNLTHALDCKKGGLVKHGHDNLRDECAALAGLAYNGVCIEPVVREAGANGGMLIADIKVNGIWESGKAAFFDNRVINADAPSYESQEWNTTSKYHATEKHKKYDKAVEDIRGSFTPLVCSVDGALHVEFLTFLRRVASTLSLKWSKSLSQVAGWIKVKVEMAVIRCVSLRLRGTRYNVRSLHLEDGAGVP